MLHDPLDLDWSAVDHAYGPATDIPDLLRTLRSPEEERRTAAVARFRDLVMHQDSLYPAGVAAVPYLIELLADPGAPDRTLGHELLAEIVPDPPETRPHRLGPRLHEIADRRSDLYLSQREGWIRHGFPPPDPIVKEAHEAVRAGVPTFVRLLDDPARDARGLSAHLLSHFPADAARIVPAIVARLAVETDGVVGSFLCLTAGTIGDPDDTALVTAVTRWRDRPGLISSWTVLMGLARLSAQPDDDMLQQLCDCLFLGPDEVYGWAFYRENVALGAALALGALPVVALPTLAPMLLTHLTAGGEDPSRFLYAARLLLSLAFPDGPFRPGDTPTPLQYAAAQVFVDSGVLADVFFARLFEECNLGALPVTPAGR
ncbi:hypothetical protein [Actinoplanes couchii]|uniref:Uncharacterized protein n=1 Tax=Actinoplanes couchii TaxID=403638 RepID=A0ABQ3XEL8_9ACTN|nr:hypothetical protein [Actinoplanes couchii]MDR6319764.1 hypothetical protein [Actinoplanes couchii]GID56898.1 hypothetical protein Aco03nite_053020 [Actinoplanes couchii]